MYLKWLPILLFIILSGCMPSRHSVLNDEHKETVLSALETALPDPTKTGSLWAGHDARIFTDPKAHKVGDLVTILVQEQASATRSLGMKKAKKSDHKTSLTAMLGYETSLSSKNTNFNPESAIDISDEKSFDGSGSTNNSDTLTASITAVVTKVYPNGNLQVVGRRQVSINHQPQVLTFTGVIRPIEIAANNTIPSSRVAQARISYGGGGELATVAHEGWLSRTLDQIWPF